MIVLLGMDVDETVLDESAGRSYKFSVDNCPCQVPVILAAIYKK